MCQLIEIACRGYISTTLATALPIETAGFLLYISAESVVGQQMHDSIGDQIKSPCVTALEKHVGIQKQWLNGSKDKQHHIKQGHMSFAPTQLMGKVVVISKQKSNHKHNCVDCCTKLRKYVVLLETNRAIVNVTFKRAMRSQYFFPLIHAT